MRKIKDFFSNFAIAFAGALIATTIFMLGRQLIFNHQLGFAVVLLLSILTYALIYSFLFALLHIGGNPTFGTTLFASVLMVVGTNLFVYGDEKYVGFTVLVALGQLALALMLTASTYLCGYIDRTPLAVGKS